LKCINESVEQVKEAEAKPFTTVYGKEDIVFEGHSKSGDKKPSNYSGHSGTNYSKNSRGRR
jgi:hypothetical protein